MLAHVTTGFGNLGISLWFVMYGLVVVLGLAVLAVRAQPALEPAEGPAPATDTGTGPAPGTLGRAVVGAAHVVGLFLYAVVLLAALFGDPGRGSNPAALTVWVGFFLLLSVLSMVFGDFWPPFSPSLTVGLLVDRIRGRTQAGAETEIDDAGRRDWWVPALLLFTFEAWWTAIFDSHGPRQAASWLAGFSVVMVVGAIVSGAAWCRRNDPFTVVFGAFAKLAPFGIVDGRPALLHPMARLARMRGDRRTGAVLSVVIGSILFDHAASSTWWLTKIATLDENGNTAVSLVALVWFIVLVAAVASGASRFAAHRARQRAEDPDDLPTGSELSDAMSPALIPIAAGLLVAYAIPQLLIQLQNIVILSSDPFGKGWDLFGTLDNSLHEQPISPGTAGWLQVLLVGLGGVASIVVAQRRLAAALDEQTEPSVIPLALFVLVVTLGGVRLVLGT